MSLARLIRSCSVPVSPKPAARVPMIHHAPAHHLRVCVFARFLVSSCTQAIEKEFGTDVEVTAESTPTTSGALEVQIKGGALVHSKLGGGGYVDSPDKMKKIIEGIRAHISGGAA
jgi:selT/selW/selH-like putative selenoprotein